MRQLERDKTFKLIYQYCPWAMCVANNAGGEQSSSTTLVAHRGSQDAVMLLT
jgi:hypothetical protein